MKKTLYGIMYTYGMRKELFEDYEEARANADRLSQEKGEPGPEAFWVVDFELSSSKEAS